MCKCIHANIGDTYHTCMNLFEYHIMSQYSCSMICLPPPMGHQVVEAKECYGTSSLEHPTVAALVQDIGLGPRIESRTPRIT